MLELCLMPIVIWDKINCQGERTCMNKKYYEQFDETIYTKVLSNGLTVKLLPKNDFNKTFGLFSTNFGSVDTKFTPYGEDEETKVPNGIAHFLEHILFKKETGDAMSDFQALGASSNAYTSFTNTAYLFSSTTKVKENVELLLDFVQDPYFTEKTVSEEQGIIAQEIAMYEDDPDSLLINGIIELMYTDHPVKIDILGSVDSIQKITPEDLYASYNTFYHPSNMTLQLAGQMDVEALMAVIEDNQVQKEFPPVAEIKRQTLNEDLNNIVSYKEGTADISRPKVAMGLRGDSRQLTQVIPYKEQMALKLLTTMLFGSLSKSRLDLYDSGILDSSFSANLWNDRSYDFLLFVMSTNQVEESIEAVKDILFNYKESPELNARHLETIKKRMTGNNIKSLNSIEYMANQLTTIYGKDKSNFDYLPIIETITMDDIMQVAEKYIDENRLAIYVLKPKQ